MPVLFYGGKFFLPILFSRIWLGVIRCSILNSAATVYSNIVNRYDKYLRTLSVRKYVDLEGNCQERFSVTARRYQRPAKLGENGGFPSARTA